MTASAGDSRQQENGSKGKGKRNQLGTTIYSTQHKILSYLIEYIPELDDLFYNVPTGYKGNNRKTCELNKNKVHILCCIVPFKWDVNKIHPKYNSALLVTDSEW